jgi:hypothetical protein
VTEAAESVKDGARSVKKAAETVRAVLMNIICTEMCIYI